MTRRFRRIRVFLAVGFVLIAFMFVLPVFLPAKQVDWYSSNLHWLIPLVIVIFVAPTVPLLLAVWELHFTFQTDDPRGGIVFTVENLGTVPFSFNRIQLSSVDWLRRRRCTPADGFFGDVVELHGAGTASQILHEHVGCTVEKGSPITVHLRNPNLPRETLAIGSKGNVRLRLYYSGTGHEAYSQKLPATQVKCLREKASSVSASV